MKKLNLILPTIVIAQFCCTSLWFVGNGIMEDLIKVFELKESALAHLTSSVQLGFITGTLVFAILSIADRYSPSKIFFICATLGAIFNVGISLEHNTLWSLIGIRFGTGFFLAGIYPVGMKIAADYYGKSLGKSLGYLVGALVLGTALPHLLAAFTYSFAWESVIYGTSLLAFLGGLMMVVTVPDGPYRTIGSKFELSACIKIFGDKKFRSAAFGYFGHMWELYTYWAFVPVILLTYQQMHSNVSINISLVSFFVIALGGIACILGGNLSMRWDTKLIATIALALSCICCLLSPLAFLINQKEVFIFFLLFWGAVVIMDSPLFSTLVAQSAVPKIKGTALTIVTCLGFALTIVSIQLINSMIKIMNPTNVYVLLAIGPILGIMALIKK